MSEAIYLIESGTALEMVKNYIAERKRVRLQNLEMLRELGLEQKMVWTNRSTGVLTAINAQRGQQPEGFTAPDSKGRSRPKKGTEWAKRFDAQIGYTPVSESIACAFNIPLSTEYTVEGGGHGWCCIGSMLSECGFLFLGEQGPYAMWIPDVKKIISDMEADGRKVHEDTKRFDMTIEGCRRIEPEEWEIMVMQHKLIEKRKSQEGGAA